MAAKIQHPLKPSDPITPEYVNSLIAEVDPSIRVETLRTAGSKEYGEQFVSTSGRAVLDVRYSPGSPAGLPERLVLKITRAAEKSMVPFDIIAPFYLNEVNFYKRIRPELELETPRCFGADFDHENMACFAILLEDVTLRGAEFLNVTKAVTVENMRQLLATQARLHAHFWLSPRLLEGGDLEWVETQVDGKVANLNMNLATPIIQNEIDTVQHKRELLQMLRTTGPKLRAGTLALHRHQQKLPFTLVEGDMHLGNTYRLPDGTGGLADWQLMTRSHHMHDVNYIITTGLTIEDRRDHEQELLRYYLDCLGTAGGFIPPSFEQTWPDYCRCLVWGVYIGWLTCPVVNYGWQINVINHLRLVTAYQDHEVGRRVAEIM
jgi:hypothetical protein